MLENTIEQVLVTAINNSLSKKDTFLITLENNIELVLSQGDDKTLTNIDKRMEDLQTQLLTLASTKSDYDDVADEIYHLHEQKQQILVENANHNDLRKRITDMTSFLKEQDIFITEYNEQLVRRLIDKVTVYEDKFTVEFKSGVTVDVNE